LKGKGELRENIWASLFPIFSIHMTLYQSLITSCFVGTLVEFEWKLKKINTRPLEKNWYELKNIPH